ncbi:hypothetical protein HYALB_00008637 [Hymenoscyphus albidus]|uniref:Uncharacterized protein n=1 Tax=Hymenoscyphus albidus TaxID=595503 RepID=A0A9N9Q2U0_9HELO|nr:hypothetical protein HYALB_00008637 [Hymenoscyphus albidus]
MPMRYSSLHAPAVQQFKSFLYTLVLMPTFFVPEELYQKITFRSPSWVVAAAHRLPNMDLPGMGPPNMEAPGMGTLANLTARKK